jgi:hypothetical protein
MLQVITLETYNITVFNQLQLTLFPSKSITLSHLQVIAPAKRLKIKLSLFFKEQCHEDVWKRESKSPLILNIDIRLKYL